MLLKIAPRGEYVIKYPSAQRFETLREDAMKQHQAMVREQLLVFPMHSADFEIADLAHDTHWLDKSMQIFRTLFLFEDNQGAALCREYATQLLVTIKVALLSVLPMVHAQDGTMIAFEMQPLRTAAKTAIEWYFDIDGGGGLQMLDVEYDDSASPEISQDQA